MKYDIIPSRQLDILHILWSVNNSQSVDEIAEKTLSRFAKSIITELTLGRMLSKGLILRTGEYGTSHNKESPTGFLYSPNIAFSEYYYVKFKRITSENLFHLVTSIIQSDKLNVSMLEILELIIQDKIKKAK